MQVYNFRVSLLRNKRIVREIAIVRRSTLYRFARAITDAYGFYFDHCFGFFDKISETSYFDAEKKYELFTDLIEEGQSLEPSGAGSVKDTKLSQVWSKPGDTMLFLFDYGDGWLFVIELIDISERDSRKKYPYVIRKLGRAPKQY